MRSRQACRSIRARNDAAMKLAIMQPYFFPYIGYWQLIRAVNRFVIYDDVNYMKGGWVNRNRILINGGSAYITIPLHRASPFKRILRHHAAVVARVARPTAQDFGSDIPQGAGFRRRVSGHRAPDPSSDGQSARLPGTPAQDASRFHGLRNGIRNEQSVLRQ